MICYRPLRVQGLSFVAFALVACANVDGSDDGVEIQGAESADSTLSGDMSDSDDSPSETHSALSASIPMTIPTPSASETRSKTTVLSAGTYDMKNKRIGVAGTKSCGGEGQPAVFELANGVTLRNLIIMGGPAGGNGIVCKGNCTLENVYWEDVCEDAATLTGSGATMRLNRVIAKSASDKVFQHNAKGGSRTIITNSYLVDFGKVWRSCGDCTSNGGPRHLELDNVRVERVGSAVAGANENYGDTVTIRNLYVKGGYSGDKPKICQVFKGVEKGHGSSAKLYGGASQWNTRTCNVSKTDVMSW